jgi:hypothetical protein
MLPYQWTAIYDRLGILSLFLMFFFGGRVVMFVVGPALLVIRSVLVSL